MSAWDEARLGGSAGQRYALGLWHPLHKLASLAWVPPVSERKKLFGRQRYCYVLNFTNMGPNEVQNDRFSITSDFWWTDIAASFDPAGTEIETSLTSPFSLQLFDTKNSRRYMNFPLMAYNAAGMIAVDPNVPPFPSFYTAPVVSLPYLQRRITKLPAGAQMLARVQNTQTLEPTINVQLVLGGYHAA